MANIKSKIMDTFRRLGRSDNGNGSNQDGNERRTSNSTTGSEDNDEIGPDEFPDPSAQSHQYGPSEILPNFQDLFLNPGRVNTNVQNSTNVVVGPCISFNGPVIDHSLFHFVRSSMEVNPSNNRRDDYNRRQPGERYSRSQSSQSSQSEASEGTRSQRQSRSEASSSRQQNVIPVKTQDIENLMASKIEPSHEDLFCICRNQRKNWKETYFVLGYTLGEIDTFVIETQCKGDNIRQARYRLLLDWIRTNDDSSLGHLASKLWEAEEWDAVKELAAIYKNRDNDSDDEDGRTAETSFNTR